MSLTVWTEQVAKFLRERDLRPRTKTSYRAWLDEFGAWWEAAYGGEGETLDIETVDLEDIVEWREHLQSGRGEKQPARAATVNSKLASLRALAAHFGRTLAIKRVEQQRDNAREPLEKDDVRRLFRGLRGSCWRALRNRAAVALMLYCGLRVSEVVGLSLDDLDLGERSGSVLIRQGKGNKQRKVVVPPEARRRIREYAAVWPEDLAVKREANGAAVPTRWLFLSSQGNGQPLSVRELQRIVRFGAINGKVGRPVSCHQLRHTYATHFMRAHKERGLAALQTIMGHASATTTMGYLHASQEEQQELADLAMADL